MGAVLTPYSDCEAAKPAAREVERVIDAAFYSRARPTFVVAIAFPYTPTFRNKLFGNVYRAGLSFLTCKQAYTRHSGEPF